MTTAELFDKFERPLREKQHESKPVLRGYGFDERKPLDFTAA